MNFYGSKEYHELVDELDQQVFCNCDLSAPTDIKKLDDEYYLKRYYYADIEHQEPGWAPVDGEICRMYKNDELIHEWKNIDGHSRMASIIVHSDGNKYLVFDEDLYGYSVLNLTDMKSVHYIPWESHQNSEEFEETFIWCDVHYDRDSNLIAIEGCFWACPYSVIVLDFSEPMKIVESKEWIDLWEERRENSDDNEIAEIDFVAWEEDVLRCTSLTIEKSYLSERLTRLD